VILLPLLPGFERCRFMAVEGGDGTEAPTKRSSIRWATPEEYDAGFLTPGRERHWRKAGLFGLRRQRAPVLS
jgi:hypothetical protein